MKNRWAGVLIAITVLFVGFTAGFFVGRNTGRPAVTVSVPQPQATTALEAEQTDATQGAETVPETTASPGTEVTEEAATGKVNVNTADLATLTTLPGIGEVLAQAIIDYREENGPFTSLEELTNVKGIGTKRLEAILDYATVGGS